mgnify:CR=1 FL=1
MTVDECKSDSFDIAARVPGWAHQADITVNGGPANVEAKPGHYAVITREWKQGDVITINIPMEATFIEGHSRIEEVRNQVAVKRGPIVYCIESPDLPEDTSILDAYIDSNTEFKTEHKADFLGGITTIEANLLLRPQATENMYQTLVSKPTWQSYRAQLVPYFAWSNRGTAEMTVFMPIVWR